MPSSQSQLLCFEDYPVGQKFITPSRTVTETDVVNYAALSGNWAPLHCDVEYAKTTRYGQRIVQGGLTYTISIGLSMHVPDVFGDVIANYGVDKMRFPNPVFINDTIRSELEIVDAQDHDKGGVLSYLHKVMNQRGEVVCAFTQRILIRKRGV